MPLCGYEFLKYGIVNSVDGFFRGRKVDCKGVKDRLDVGRKSF